MYNDSIDTLLLRHYGRSAPAPVDLEAHLLASVCHEAAEMGEHQQIATNLRERPVSRRRAVRQPPGLWAVPDLADLRLRPGPRDRGDRPHLPVRRRPRRVTRLTPAPENPS